MVQLQPVKHMKYTSVLSSQSMQSGALRALRAANESAASGKAVRLSVCTT